MVKWIIKKYLVSYVNDILEVNQENIVNIKNVIDTWIGRLQKILECLKTILSKLDDNKLESSEIDESVEAIEKTIKAW